MSKKPHKYRAIATEVDGIEFPSKAEARRYSELKLLEKARKIFGLQRQPRYRLCAFTNRADGPKELGHYVADFRYHTTEWCGCAWGCVVEDVKGVKTDLYRWKKKHVEAQYGITITEVR